MVNKDALIKGLGLWIILPSTVYAAWFFYVISACHLSTFNLF